MKSILTIIGTRPEAIKLSPLLSVLKKRPHFKSEVCLTGQHTDLLDPFLSHLNIVSTYRCESGDNKARLVNSATHILQQLSHIFLLSKPDLILLQGDTTTAFAAALAAFYAQIPSAHIEAGLRTGNMSSPWPEEGHRCLISRLATFFFAPTERAKIQLMQEGLSEDKIWVVGNTSIDALRQLKEEFFLDPISQRRQIVVTVHRRENQGRPLQEICLALMRLAKQFTDLHIYFLLHPNPHVRRPVQEILSGIENITLLEPLDHISFIRILDESLFVITDSGGIQEEAPFMGKPVIVVRDTTERPEGVHEGTAKLVGTEASKIFACCKELLEDEENLKNMSRIHFPYGDGYAAEKIVDILEKQLFESKT